MRKDIGLDNDFDMIVDSNDMVLQPSDDQHIRLIMKTFSGNWTQNPYLGLGIDRFLKGNLDGNFRREIQIQMLIDGYKIEDLKTENGLINLKYSVNDGKG